MDFLRWIFGRRFQDACHSPLPSSDVFAPSLLPHSAPNHVYVSTVHSQQSTFCLQQAGSSAYPQTREQKAQQTQQTPQVPTEKKKKNTSIVGREPFPSQLAAHPSDREVAQFVLPDWIDQPFVPTIH